MASTFVLFARICYLFAQLIILSSTSTAFLSSPALRFPSSISHGSQHLKRNGRQPSQSPPRHDVPSKCVMLSTDDNEEAASIAADVLADSVRRRQLLFSLLAASGASVAFPATAEENQNAEPTVAFAAPSGPVKIMKPPLDDRDYEAYVLGNGLRVLLCSDPSSNEAAVAMDVHVGACSDPDDVPGLAHFTEHMLFLGTELYPEEDSFEKFLSSNGGSSNAFTENEDTVYFFDMAAEADVKFKEGLSRFGSFFASPLFTESATSRELNAVESENAKNLQNDVFRLYQIEKSRANPNHPYSKFFTGNKKTLLDDTVAKGIDLRQELIDFYNKYYSANQMTLAVVAPQSIAVLKSMVAEAFSEIPNKNVPKPEGAWEGVAPFSGDSIIPSFGSIVQVVPVQDLRQLSFMWPMVYDSDRDRKASLLVKQADYVVHLLGHEGPGSLLSYLKRKGWANGLAASPNYEFTDFEALELTIELTTQGLLASTDVTEVLFSYINMLRTDPIPDYVFQEVLQLDELSWRFLTKGNPSSYAQSLTTAMQKYPPSLYVAGPRRIALAESETRILKSSEPRTGFSSPEQEDLTKRYTMELIDKLTPDNVIVTVVSKSFDSLSDRKEKWYGTKYRVSPVTESTLERMRNPMDASMVGIRYPKKNTFIPSEQGLKVKRPPPYSKKVSTRSFENKMKVVPPPRIIRDDGPDGRWTVYFKEDDRFGQPKAYVVLQLLTKEVYSSPKRAVLAQLYQACAVDNLEEYAYNARLAGLTFDVQILPRGVRLTFGGYNEKLPEFAAYVTRKLAEEVTSVLPKSEDEFERYKDRITRGLAAFDVKQPYAHASYYSYLTLQPTGFQYMNRELRGALETTTLFDLLGYVGSLWSSGKGVALVQGNLDKNEALALVQTIDETIGFKTIPESEIPPPVKALPLPPRSLKKLPTRLTISEPNLSNENCAVHVILMSIEKDDKSHGMIEVLSAIVEQRFFSSLRTRAQLGYIVSSGVRALEDSRTLGFIVQSSVAPAEKVSEAILKFLDDVEEDCLNPLTPGDIAVYVKGLIDRKTEPDKTLAVEASRNWNEISSGRLKFDRIQREAAALLDITKSDLVEFWKTLYYSDERRMIVSEIIPNAGPASSRQPPNSSGYAKGDMKSSEDGFVLGIDDIDKFREDRENHEVPGIGAEVAISLAG